MSRGAAARRLTWGLAAAGVTGAALQVLDRGATARSPRWARTNYRGADVDLLAGPAAAVGAVAAAVPAAAAGRPGPMLLTLVSGGLGLYDDLAGETHARGLGGHLRALRQGRVTTGLVKMVGLLSAATVAVAMDRRPTGETAVVLPAAGVLADAALISGTANLVNLLDLRPGRALKVVMLLAGPATVLDRAEGAQLAAGLVGTAAVLLPDDLGERRMIGDCGANTLGALVGWALVDGLGRRGRTVALASVVALTLASERVSFSAVIERTPALRALDRWGRRTA